MNNNLKLGGELVVKQIAKEGIKDIFTLVGNQISPILVQTKKYGINTIHTRHEQGAVHMADGWAQITRKAGVVIVSGGPGFTNTLTGIIKAHYASTPMVVITGNVPCSVKDKGNLQDTNQLSLVREYTKWCATIYAAERIPEYISRAFKIANHGKKGVVVLEIPIDILKKQVRTELIPPIDFSYSAEDTKVSTKSFDICIEMIGKSVYPVMILGDQLYYSHGEKEIGELVDILGIPVFTMNKSRGIIPDSHKLCFGSGRVIEGGPQLYAYKKTDLVITIGVNLDYQLGQFEEPYFNQKCNYIGLHNLMEECIAVGQPNGYEIHGNIKENIKKLISILKQSEIKFDYVSWVNELRNKKEDFFEQLGVKKVSKGFLSSYQTLKTIENFMKKDSIIVLDGSNAMFWAALMLPCDYPGQLIIAPDGTYGPMGTGLALAIGAKVADKTKDVILYTGDGSFGFNAMEIDTLYRLGLSIKIFVHNDSAWGLCKSTQKLLYNQCDATDIENVDYGLLVESLGGRGITILTEDELKEALEQYYHQEVISCFNLIMDENEYSPGTLCFNETLRKQV